MPRLLTNQANTKPQTLPLSEVEKEQNIDDDLIQYYSGSESKEALKIYDKLKISNNSESYNKIMKGFPI